jgi:hypothetical protein
MSSRKHIRDDGGAGRPLDRAERAVLAKLLDAEFPGKKALLEQARGVKVQSLDANGSLALKPADDSTSAGVTRRIPVEAELDDHDGTTIHVLLHVVDERMSELEIYRDDGAPLQRPVSAEKLRIIIL